MNKIAKICVAILSTLALVSGSAYAAKPGAYLGAGIGGSKQDTPDQYLVTGEAASHFKQDKPGIGFAGRAFGGYNFNQYFGVEAGIAHYAPSTYKTGINGDYVKLDYNLNAIDLVGKAYLPLGESGFNLYALGGAAYAQSKKEGKVKVNGVSRSDSQKDTKLRPIYGLGASYDIPNSPITTSLEFTRLQGKGNVKNDGNAIPSANMATINFTYNLD